MIRSLSIPVVLAVATISTAVASVPALAQHHHHGHSHSSFPGERALTGAMHELELAHEDAVFSHQRSHILSAMHRISIAQTAVRSPLAQRELAHAYEHLNEYLYHGSHRDLDLAQAHLRTAYDVSRPVVVRRPVVRPVPPRVLTPPVVLPAPPIHHPGGLSFGNGQFQFRIGF